MFVKIVMKLIDFRNINEVYIKMLFKMKVDSIEFLLIEIFDLLNEWLWFVKFSIYRIIVIYRYKFVFSLYWWFVVFMSDYRRLSNEINVIIVVKDLYCNGTE